MVINNRASIAFVTALLSEIRGGPLLMLNFARALRTIRPEIHLKLISIEKKQVDLVSRLFNIGVNSGIDMLDFVGMSEHPEEFSLIPVFRSLLKDMSIYGSINPQAFIKLLFSKTTAYHRATDSRKVVELVKRLSSYDLVHVGDWTAPYSVAIATMRGRRHELKRTKFVCHPILHLVHETYIANRFRIGATSSTILFRLTYHLTSLGLRKVLSCYDAITASTPFTYKLLRGLGLDNVYFVGEGIDMDYIQKIEPVASRIAEEIRRELDTDHVFLYIGPKIYSKGYFDLVRAFNDFNNKDEKKAILIVIGRSNLGAEDPRYPYRLERQLTKRGCMKMYECVSELEKYALIAASDAIVIPSSVETVPIVFLEAWAMKKPVIGVDMPTVASVVLSGQPAGILVKYGDLKSLKNAMIRIKKDMEFAELLGKNGYKKVSEVYNLRKVGQRLLKVYNKIT